MLASIQTTKIIIFEDLFWCCEVMNYPTKSNEVTEQFLFVHQTFVYY